MQTSIIIKGNVVIIVFISLRCSHKPTPEPITVFKLLANSYLKLRRKLWNQNCFIFSTASDDQSKWNRLQRPINLNLNIKKKSGTVEKETVQTVSHLLQIQRSVRVITVSTQHVPSSLVDQLFRRKSSQTIQVAKRILCR